MLPLPSRTHPKKQNLVVYTKELTHLLAVKLALPRISTQRLTRLLAAPFLATFRPLFRWVRLKAASIGSGHLAHLTFGRVVIQRLRSTNLFYAATFVRALVPASDVPVATGIDTVTSVPFPLD